MKTRVIHYLNRLLRVNLDRSLCYEHAVTQLRNTLRSVDAGRFFIQLLHECERNARELIQVIQELEGTPAVNNSFTAKLTVWWMDVQHILVAKPVFGILMSCEANDRHALRIYDSVLASNIDISGTMRQRILDHRIAIDSACNLLCTYRALQNTDVITNNR